MAILLAGPPPRLRAALLAALALTPRAQTPARPLAVRARALSSKEVRKAIARVLTVMNQTQKDALRAFYKDAQYKPLDLRAKKTRAIRRRLTPKQAAKKTKKQFKKDSQFPLQKYALRV